LEDFRKLSVDVAVYGTKCSGNELPQLRKFIFNTSTHCNYFLLTNALSEHSCEPESLSRYATHNEAFLKESFISALTSLAADNVCEFHYKPLFSFKGQKLDKNIKKMLLNVWNALILAKQHPVMLEGGPDAVAANLTGLSRWTLHHVRKQWKEKQCVSGGKKPVQPKRKLLTFDGFDKLTVHNLITKAYAEGRVITFLELFNEFMPVKEETRQEELRLKALHPELLEVGGPF